MHFGQLKVEYLIKNQMVNDGSMETRRKAASATKYPGQLI